MMLVFANGASGSSYSSFCCVRDDSFTEGVSHWTKTHWSWIRRQTFDFEAQNQLLADAIATADQAQSRITRLNADIHDALADWRLGPLVQNLQAFCGIQELTAVGIVAEIGDFERFPTAAKFMSFIGLVPSEASSGPTRRQGGITKSGNRHVSTSADRSNLALLSCPTKREPRTVTAAPGLPQEVIDIADNAAATTAKTLAEVAANQEVCHEDRHRGLARELAGFLWSAAITTQRLHREQTSPPATSKRAKHDRDKQQHTKREQTPLPTEFVTMMF
ncbi:MAG: transposase [Planctomycetaceae bacterium]